MSLESLHLNCFKSAFFIIKLNVAKKYNRYQSEHFFIGQKSLIKELCLD
jgi:hypothetical protein